MWPSGAGSRPPCPRESALRRAAVSGNLQALPPGHVPLGRSVRVFICANPDDTEAERIALKEHVYPKLRDFCRENYGIEFQHFCGLFCDPDLGLVWSGGDREGDWRVQPVIQTLVWITVWRRRGRRVQPVIKTLVWSGLEETGQESPTCDQDLGLVWSGGDGAGDD
ncbi:hypothetical protein NHX12_014042 [Muraenolepis orangiensis]|uniref:Uncharacterized protein n=1 Tax=Muraenolepis orangiensis TaxID=630683 RepID=A0A9Q0DBK8_9TELE|nr:hypothetical protein NHX12_014042 [Muraenolepis orangiensis]